MLRSLLIGEEIYGIYKAYSRKFIKGPSLKTHWMLIEQLADFNYTMSNHRERLNNPKSVLRFISGSYGFIASQLAEIDSCPKFWGRVIIPPTQAIYSTALEDIKRMNNHLKDTIFHVYQRTTKDEFRKNNNNEHISAGHEWGFLVKSTYIMIDSGCQELNYEEIINSIKEFWLNTLAQAHAPLKNRTHEEYLAYVDELEEIRTQRFGFFSAIKQDAIYQAVELERAKKLAKLQKQKDKEAKKDKKDKKESKESEAEESDNEQPKKSKSTKRVVKDDSGDEQPKKSKSTKRVVKDDSDDEQPKKSKSTKRVVKDTSGSEDEQPKKSKSTKSVVKKSTKRVEHASDSDDIQENDEIPDSE
jgi:hypothetical protein